MRSKSDTNSQARERTGRHWYPDDGESRFTARTFPVDSSSHSCRLRYRPWHASNTSLAFICAPAARAYGRRISKGQTVNFLERNASSSRSKKRRCPTRDPHARFLPPQPSGRSENISATPINIRVRIPPPDVRVPCADAASETLLRVRFRVRALPVARDAAIPASPAKSNAAARDNTRPRAFAARTTPVAIPAESPHRESLLCAHSLRFSS